MSIALGILALFALLLSAPASAAVPTVTIDAPSGITDSAARVSGVVDPQDLETTYSFQYSTDQVTWTNVGGGDPLEAGSGPQGVSATLSLQANTTYFVRLVAGNADGQTFSDPPNPSFTTDPACPNARFRQGAGARLPSCRAYEQVSPVDKNSFDVSQKGTLAVSEVGDAAMFASDGAFAGYPSGGALGAINFYYAHLQGGGWSTVPAAPRPSEPSEQTLFDVSTDLSASVMHTVEHGFGPNPPPGSNLYFHDNETGATIHLASVPDSTGFGNAGSADLEHTAVTSPGVLVDDPGVPASGPKVYDIAADGSIELVSRQPGTDEPFTTQATVAGFGSSGEFFGTGSSPRGAGAISTDGSKIFFETPATFSGPSDESALIYRRSNGATELASPSQRTVVDPLGPLRKIFMRATPDGTQVFFKSSELLTDNANTGPTRGGADLYRYDMEADELRDISATPAGDGASVEGVVGVSDNGDRVYYVALGEVVSGGTAGQPNLYLWEDDGTPEGDTRFIATLGSADSKNRATSSSFKTAAVTGDGRYAVLTSVAPLTGYPNEGTTQLYHYDAEAAGGAGELQCVSCNPSGDPPTGPSSAPDGSLFPRLLSEDGRYVFFDSSDALVAGDTNDVTDAYVWSAGSVALLSSGTSPSASTSAGASADGTRAFFITREKLVPQDGDSNTDLYGAVVGGGLLSQQAVQLPSCAGEGCRGAGSVPPVGQAPLTPSFIGAGNVSHSPAQRCGKGKRKVRARNGKTRCVKRHKQGGHKRTGSKTGRASR